MAPQIGTLVIAVDRAKNLPNLNLVGKQDPYCASAAVGKKEAKKTTIRHPRRPDSEMVSPLATSFPAVAADRRLLTIKGTKSYASMSMSHPITTN